MGWAAWKEGHEWKWGSGRDAKPLAYDRLDGKLWDATVENRSEVAKVKMLPSTTRGTFNSSLVESDSTRAPVVRTTKELRRSCRGKTSVLLEGAIWVDLETRRRAGANR